MLNQMRAGLRSKELIFDSLILENYLKKVCISSTLFPLGGKVSTFLLQFSFVSHIFVGNELRKLQIVCRKQRP